MNCVLIALGDVGRGKGRGKTKTIMTSTNCIPLGRRDGGLAAAGAAATAATPVLASPVSWLPASLVLDAAACRSAHLFRRLFSRFRSFLASVRRRGPCLARCSRIRRRRNWPSGARLGCRDLGAGCPEADELLVMIAVFVCSQSCTSRLSSFLLFI